MVTGTRGRTRSPGRSSLAIRRLRQGSYFREWLLERRRWSEQALIGVVATSYLPEVSTRRVGTLPGPEIGAADPRDVPDRQCECSHRPGPAGRGGSAAAQTLPQPTDAAVGLALVRQAGNRCAQSRATSAREARLAAAAQQVADLRDGEQLGVTASRRGLGRRAIATIRSSIST